MKITSVSGSPTVPKPLYPVIKRVHPDEGLQVLFVGPKRGIVLACSSSAYLTGFFATDWAEEVFVPSNDAFTLQND